LSSSFASLPTSLARRFVALAAWKRFALITLVVAGPYALYVSYLWIRLQSGLLRAPVRVTTPRAVLIVGTQSSGTTQMSAELGKIGFEVAHETSDAQWDFARDGTISWFHAMRFMPGRADLAFTTAICSRFRRSMGFHPAMFGPPKLGRVPSRAGPRTTASARRASILKDFLSRRVSPRTPRFQSRRASTPFNSATDAFERHPDVRSYGR
jgi:hypothetical protein